VAEPFVFPSPDEPPPADFNDEVDQTLLDEVDDQTSLDDQETFDGTPTNHQHSEL